MYQVFPYQGTGDTARKMLGLIKGPRGEQSLRLRQWVEDTVRNVKARDKLSQLVAIYDRFNRHFSYLNDPIKLEFVKDPERLLDEMEQTGVALGDCDCASTFLAAAPRTIGIHTGIVRVGFHPLAGTYSHVFAVGHDQHGRRIALDPVANQKTTEMLGRVKATAYNGG